MHVMQNTFRAVGVEFAVSRVTNNCLKLLKLDKYYEKKVSLYHEYTARNYYHKYVVA